MKKIMLSFGIISLCLLMSCDTLQQMANNIPNNLPSNGSLIPTESEMIAALKEALQVGSNNAANTLHQSGGYLNNSLIKIPFPQDAINVANKLRELGFGQQVDQFVETMNRGAEDAAIQAAPIFVNAIQQMSLTDAKNILLGADNSATMYFKSKTSGALYQAFAPKIQGALDKFSATKYWTQLTTTYNKIPFVQPVQTDLVQYATNKALDGLFIKVAEEEATIRHNISARVSDQLRKVFGWADAQKK